jgi:hypothetical protein
MEHATKREEMAVLIRHWLLSLVVEHPVSLGWLFPVVKSQGLNVKAIPHADAEDYAKGLEELFAARMVKLESEFPEDDVESDSGVSRILDRFRKGSSEPDRLPFREVLPRARPTREQPRKRVYFQLTAHGGEAWEKVAEPDWGRYISASTYSGVGPQDGELVSADRDLLIAYMGWYPEVNGEQIQRDTITWQTHTDFEVLYWKRLPFVHHASFKVLPAQARWNNYREPQWFRDWWVSSCSWHKKPWELPSWPSE